MAGNTKQKTKVRKKWVCLKKSQEKSGNLTKFEKYQVFSVQAYKIPYFPKPRNGKKLIENPLKQAKIETFPRNLQNYLVSNAFIWQKLIKYHL